MRGQKGITLVALIITIVVLLILAVVAVTAITDTDIINKSQDAGQRWNNAVSNEQTEINTATNYLQNYYTNIVKD